MERCLKILALDVGNTSTAACLWKDGRISNAIHCDGSFAETSKRILALLDKATSKKNKEPVTFAYSSVVPKMDSKWKSFALRGKLPFHQISYADFTRANISNITFDYPKSETIGQDRLADAAAAVERYGAPVIVMDFGTALSAAAITKDFVWRGGVIAPGFPLMRDYLFERTAKLPRLEIGRGQTPKIGRSTIEAMRFGALVGYRGMVREITTQLRKNFNQDFKLVATGGYAKWALKSSGLDFIIDPNLTLFGVGLIAAKARQKDI